MGKSKRKDIGALESKHDKSLTEKKQLGKKKFWKRKVKGVKKKNECIKQIGLPPKSPDEFSSNWKCLQEMLTLKPVEMDISNIKSKTKESDLKTRFPHGKGNTSRTSVKPGEKPTDGLALSSTKSYESVKISASIKQKNDIEKKSVGTRKKCATGHSGSDGLKEHKGRKTEAQPKQAKDVPDIWFDDVDPEDIEAALGSEVAECVRTQMGETKPSEKSPEQLLVKENAFSGLTRAVAMDCEMVGIGPDGEDSIVARVSIVNQFGKCIYDKYVKPTEKVTDYRTAVSGIRPKDIKHGEDFHVIQNEVAHILQGRTLVGHAVHNDLKVLLLDHPKRKIRDTQRHKPFKRIVKSGRPSLKLLCEVILDVKVQEGEHSSVQDAQAAMRLYTSVKKEWESELKASRKSSHHLKSNASVQDV
ncbi:RNA exonuclease 4 [Protopterus annectens]|uniref:RNA exonuclease 4 n=1 Tax=Protopterus annectens TaxID=7888 RepID=UPI001CFB2898|nr:RNA exonuclease 4 [Protopterus annectens]XP_043914165.1 RNA exonuclease 4 [Protopterus annectens]XP_043914167.1 RNA exonuclease 4 [Protopterus annectens]